MDIDRAFQRSETAKKFTLIGASLIASLREYMNAEFDGHFIISDSSTTHRLFASFYGLRLLFRIEIMWGGDAMGAAISTYGLSDTPPKEVSMGVSFGFDTHGNVGSGMTKDDFAAILLAKLLSNLHAGNAVLTP